MEAWIFLGFVALVIVGAIFGSVHSRRERDLLASWAHQLGLQFQASAASSFCDRFVGFEPFGSGHSESAENLIHGDRRGLGWQIFQYHYKTGSGDNESSHSYQIVAATVPSLLTRMRIRPENLVDKLKGLAGFEDINFESEAFSRRYFVACSDRKFAYDLIHPQMIDYLMALPAIDWQIAGNQILLHRSGSCNTLELQQMVGRIEGFIDRMPDFLKEDRSLQARS